MHKILLNYSDKDTRHRGEYKKDTNRVAAFDANGNEIGSIFETATPFDTPHLNATTAYIQNGTIVFPNTAGAWWPDFLDELLTFPASTFKDQCDAFSQGIGHIDSLYLSARRGYF